MAQYVVLGNFTEQGVKGLKNSAAMRAGAEQAIAAKGGKMIWQGLTFGQYDFVALVEMPGDEQVLEVNLMMASQGSVKTQTLKAFSPQEVDRVTARLP